MSDREAYAPTSIFVQSVVRPKRVAFLFDSEKATLAEIDEVILAATECWGGAYWPLVPFTAQGIAEEWWKVLEAVDPDVVCVLHEISDSIRDQIARRCAPLRILQSPTTAERRGGRRLVSGHLIGAISTAQIATAMSAEQTFLPKAFRFLVLEDKGGAGSANRAFALRNFGALPKDVRFTRSFDELAHLWLDASEKPPAQLFGALSAGVPATTPRDLARFRADRPFEPAWTTESRAFWIVVGDSPLDVALAWNSAVAHSPSHGRSCIWLSTADAADEDLLSELSNWIGRNYYSPHGEGTGLVLSYSQPVESLNAAATKMRSSLRFTARVLSPSQSLFGQTERPIRSSVESSRIEQVPIRNESGLVEFVRPPFAPAHENECGWMVDLEIEHPRDPSIISNLPVWKVPRRPGVATAFGGERRNVRITWNRTPSFEVTSRQSQVRFRIPSAGAIFQWCLVPTRVDRNGELTVALEQGYRLETSDAGLQLRGVLELFGGLYQAGSTFEDPFWRQILTELSGRPEDARARQIKAVQQVLSEAAKDTGSIAVAQLSTLAERVAEKAWRSDPNTRQVAINKLPSRFGAFVADWIKKNPSQSSFPPGAKFDDRAADDLANLLENGVLLQGTQLRCPACFTEFWRHVDDLRRSNQCPGCLSSVQLLPNPSWSAQANELVSGALRQRGVLAVIHALYDLQRLSLSKTFTFIASQDVFTYPERTRITDLDLLVLLDGALLIGEVKSNARGFDEASVASMVKVAKVMLPDELMFAAEADADGSDWPPEVAKLFDRATEDLKQVGVRVRRELLRWL